MQNFLKDKEIRQRLMKDLFASVVVFLVALPLCMGIAIACNLPPALGIATGIVGGLIIGALSGSPLMVSGPAAGLVIVVVELIHKHGPEKMFFIVLLAGLIQVIAGFSRLAQWFRAVPPSVVNGMLSGIGILIFASQFHVMVDDSPKGSGIRNLISIPMAIWKGINPSGDSTYHVAAPIGLLTIVILVLWARFARGKLKLLPGSLLAVVVATIASLYFNLPIHRVALPQDLLEPLSWPPTFQLDWLKTADVYLAALGIALIATAETLLTATALDKMHKGTRTNYDRELMAQGVGNMICGAIGALPMTGVMVRSGVNVSAGAKTRCSTIFHGFLLLLFVSTLPFVIRTIPTCSLAALLVYTGYKLANFGVWRSLWSYGRSEVIIYVITVGTIICVDLLTGVMLGIGLSIAKLIYIFAHLEIRVDDDPVQNRSDMHFNGAASFLNLPRIAGALETIRADTELHIHLDELDYIDHACLDLIMSWDTQHQSTGGRLVIDWGTLGSKFKDSRMSKGDVKTKEFDIVFPSTGPKKSDSGSHH